LQPWHYLALLALTVQTPRPLAALLTAKRRTGKLGHGQTSAAGTFLAGFKYIENESFQSTFSELFSEINLGSDKLGKTYSDRNAKLCTIITKIAEGLAEFGTQREFGLATIRDSTIRRARETAVFAARLLPAGRRVRQGRVRLRQ
jgi:hypothetical protein